MKKAFFVGIWFATIGQYIFSQVGEKGIGFAMTSLGMGFIIASALIAGVKTLAERIPFADSELREASRRLEQDLERRRSARLN